MNSMIKPILESYRFSNFIINKVLDDISNEDAVKRIRNGEGSSISWIVGHLIDYRSQSLNLLSSESQREFKEIFSDASASDGSNYPSLTELKEKWNNQHNVIESTFANISDEQLSALLKKDDAVHNEKTVLSVIIFYMWHEAYHIGALGMIRKELEYKSTSDLAACK